MSWASSDTAVASFDSSQSPGLATGGRSGTATISATDPVSGFRATALLTVMAARLDRIEITPPRATIPLGSAGQFTAEGIYGDGRRMPITTMLDWSSSSTHTAEVGNQAGRYGHIITHAIGPTSISATHLASGTSATVTLIVTNPIIATIRVRPAQARIGIGRNQRFEAIAVYSDRSELNLSRQVEWRSTDVSVASVSNQATSAGTANGLSVGTATISAFHATSGVSSTNSNDSAVLVVLPAVLTSIAVTPLQVDVPLGASQAFTATGLFSSGPSRDITAQVRWQSSDQTVASVSSSTSTPGLAQSLRQGQTNIIATDPRAGISSDDSSRSAVLTVRAPELIRIEVSPSVSSMVVMGQQQFTAMAYYSDGTQNDISRSRLTTWATTSSNVVSVNSIGLASANSVGNAVISARDTRSTISSDDSNTSASVIVMVAMLTSISISPASVVIPTGVTTQLIATGTYNNGASANVSESVTWNSSNTTVATVSNSAGSRGQLNSLSVGGAMITASDPTSMISSDTSGQSTSVTVNNVLINALSISPSMPSTLSIGDTLQFSSMATFTDGSMYDVTHSVNWSSSNPAVGRIGGGASNRGRVQAMAIGSTNISARAASPSIAISNSVRLTVSSSNLFSDDFEDGDFSDWSGQLSPFRIDSSRGANRTSKSLMIGANTTNGHYNGVYHTLPSIQPSEVGVYVRTDRVAPSGYVVLGNDSVGNGSNHGIIFFHFAAGNRMYVYSGSTRYGDTAYVVNRWYHLEFKNINWTTKRFDYYVDGTRLASSIPFRDSTTTSLTRIHFYNFRSAISWWDEIVMR